MPQSSQTQSMPQIIQRLMNDTGAALGASNYKEASRIVCMFLDQLYNGSELAIEKPSLRRNAYRRIAEALIHTVGKQPADFLRESYGAFSRRKHLIALLLSAAGVSHLSGKALLDTVLGAEGHDADIRRVLVLTTLATMAQSPMANPQDVPGDIAAPFLIGGLSELLVLTPEQEAARTLLLENSDIVRSLPLRALTSSGLSAAWMRCSYALCDARHALKRATSHLVADWAKAQGMTPWCAPAEQNHAEGQKPRLLIYADVMKRTHAMFRCHGASAIAMRRHFHTILVTGSGADDPYVAQHFDDAIQLPGQSVPLHEKLRMMQKLGPDIVYMPSVGMSMLSILLANFRIAPVQFMSLGHPASSMGTAMDYVVMNPDLKPDPGAFSETIVERPKSGGYQPAPDFPQGYAPDPKARRGKDQPIEIGIPAYAPKLNTAFITTLARLERESSRQIRFNFMPNGSELLRDAAAAEIGKLLSNTRVLPRARYMDYMAALAEQDLVLTPYPFGNTNGTIDTLLNRVPLVAMAGQEPFACTDARLVRKLGLEDGMIAQTEEEYFQAALQFIEKDDLRQKLAEKIAYLDAESCFYDGAGNEDVADIAFALFQKYEQLQAAR